MMDFITTHWGSILVVLAFGVLIVALALRGKKEIVFKMLYALCDEAEKRYGAGTGKQKFAYVMEKAYTAMPAIIKVFITYDAMAEWIEEALAKLKADLQEKAEKEKAE
jgi:hypothetical protein